MAADLHIHILTEEFTEEHYAAFQANTFGSRFFNLNFDKNQFEKEHNCNLHMLCTDTPNVWVGEVSWLKAALFEKDEIFVPSPIQQVSSIIGESFPIIDDAFIEKIRKALQVANQTGYRITSARQGTCVKKSAVVIPNKNTGKIFFLIISLTSHVFYFNYDNMAVKKFILFFRRIHIVQKEVQCPDTCQCQGQQRSHFAGGRPQEKSSGLRA